MTVRENQLTLKKKKTQSVNYSVRTPSLVLHTVTNHTSKENSNRIMPGCVMKQLPILYTIIYIYIFFFYLRYIWIMHALPSRHTTLVPPVTDSCSIIHRMHMLLYKQALVDQCDVLLTTLIKHNSPAWSSLSC